MRERVSAKTIWEDVVGYSRAVRVGSHVFVSGTSATDAGGEVHGEADAYRQSVYILEKIEAALMELGAERQDIVRTRIFITDVSLWESVALAHSEFFDEIRPCATMVEVSRLLSPELLVEIEADAIHEG